MINALAKNDTKPPISIPKKITPIIDQLIVINDVNLSTTNINATIAEYLIPTADNTSSISDTILAMVFILCPF